MYEDMKGKMPLITGAGLRDLRAITARATVAVKLALGMFSSVLRL